MEMKRSLKILVLEDSDDDVMLIERELKKAGMIFSSLVVSDKHGFETALLNYEPDVILCDHFLPDYNSVEAFQLFKKHQKETHVLIPFILVTGNISEEFSIQSIKSGIDDYILKDRLKRLPLAIESALEKCRIESERVKYLEQVIARERLMNEASGLGHFGSWEADLVTGKHRWSDALFSIYGFTPEETEPDYQTFLSIVHPDDVVFLKTTVEHTLKTTNEVEFEFRVRDRQGKVKYVSSKLKVERDADGKPVRLVGFNLDITERKKTAMALKKSEQDFCSLLDENPNAVFSLDTLGRFTHVNEGFVEMVGYSREEMLGTDFREILVKRELGNVYKHFVSSLERKPQRYETTFINKCRKSFTLDVTLMAIVVDDVTIGAHCVAKDITEKRKFERVLDQAYRTARIGSWELDLTSGRVSWAGITRELHEVPDDYEPTFETWLLFYKEGRSRDLIIDARRNCVDNDVPWDFELQIITGKGNQRWVRTIGQGIREDGKCVRLYGTFQDIHERKIAERASRKAFEEKWNVIESIGDGFFAVNRNWIVTYWNKMAERILQMPRGKVLGKNLWDIYKDAESLKFHERYHTAMRENVTLNFEEYFPALKIWVEVTVYPSSDGLSIYFKDITKQKNDLCEIQEQNRQLRDIAWIQSHEVRAPLARIIGLVNLLNDKMYLDSELPGLLDDIGNNARELDALVRDIVRKSE